MAAIKGASKRKLPPKKTGRPTDKTPELLKAICDGIAIGRSARAMCVEVGIVQSTLWKWLNESAEFSKQYTRAKEDCADYIAAEIVEIADDGSRDYVKTTDGREVPDYDHIARSRLRVDARKWYASKLAPKKYGDKVDHEVSGPNGGAIESKVTVEFVSSRT